MDNKCNNKSKVFGIGTDIIEVDRIRQALERNSNFLMKVFGENEISLC